MNFKMMSERIFNFLRKHEGIRVTIRVILSFFIVLYLLGVLLLVPVLVCYYKVNIWSIILTLLVPVALFCWFLIWVFTKLKKSPDASMDIKPNAKKTWNKFVIGGILFEGIRKLMFYPNELMRAFSSSGYFIAAFLGLILGGLTVGSVVFGIWYAIIGRKEDL